MAILEWDKTGERFYESGVSKVVLYTATSDGSNIYGKASPWNGVTSINESPDGADPNDLWADNIKYASLYSAETFGFTVEAYTYPEAWNECNGLKKYLGVYIAQQERANFGLCYRTEVGNDTATSSDDKYILHLIYGAMAQPSDRDYETINDSPDAIQFSWECTTTPVKLHTAVNDATLKPISTLTVSSSHPKIKDLEDILYGTVDDDGRLPQPDEVIALLTAG